MGLLKNFNARIECIEKGQIQQYAPGITKECSPHLEYKKFIEIGGESINFLVFNTIINRKEILKLRKTDLSRIAKERFYRSIECLNLLENTRQFPILYTASKNPAYMTVEYIDGLTVREFVRQNELTLKEKIRIWKSAAGAVKQLHEIGIMHRDIKPDNIMIRNDGSIVLIDFGLSKSIMSPTLTRVGDPVGTPFYIAPEAYLDAPNSDWRSDIFSLGRFLYFILTEDDSEFAKENLYYQKFISVISQATEPNKEDRHQKVEELIKDVEFCTQEETTSKFNTREIKKILIAQKTKDVIDAFCYFYILLGGNIPKMCLYTGKSRSEIRELLSAARTRILSYPLNEFEGT